jgi:hypothetical protein
MHQVCQLNYVEFETKKSSFHAFQKLNGGKNECITQQRIISSIQIFKISRDLRKKKYYWKLHVIFSFCENETANLEF